MKIAFIGLAFLALTACTTQSDVRPRLVEKPQMTFSEPAPLVLSNITVKYYDNNICLTNENFVALMNNMDMMKSYIEECRVTVESYKRYYTTNESTLEGAR